MNKIWIYSLKIIILNKYYLYPYLQKNKNKYYKTKKIKSNGFLPKFRLCRMSQKR